MTQIIKIDASVSVDSVGDVSNLLNKLPTVQLGSSTGKYYAIQLSKEIETESTSVFSDLVPSNHTVISFVVKSTRPVKVTSTIDDVDYSFPMADYILHINSAEETGNYESITELSVEVPTVPEQQPALLPVAYPNALVTVLVVAKRP